MTSAGFTVGRILKLFYLRQYLSKSVDQTLKILEILMAILPVVFPVKYLSRSQNGGHYLNFQMLNTASIWPQLWEDRPKLCQKSIVHGETSSMTLPGDLKVALYIHV